MKYAGASAVVLGIPRGGVPVAYEIARELKLPMDTLVVRKIPSMRDPEFGIAAIAPGDVLVLGESAKDHPEEYLNRAASAEREEMERRIERYLMGTYIPQDRRAAIAIIVDDGVASGVSIRAAVESAKIRMRPASVVVAAPVMSREIANMLRREGAEVVSVIETDDLIAVGLWYEYMPQVRDSEVVSLLERASKELRSEAV